MDTGEERVPGRDRSPRGRSASSLRSTGLSGARSPWEKRTWKVFASATSFSSTRSRPKAVDSYDWSRPSATSWGCAFVWTSVLQMGTPPQTAPQEPFQVPNLQLPIAPGVAQQMEFTRAMLQAQDEQIRQQAAQLQQMSAMLTQALQLASANAVNAIQHTSNPLHHSEHGQTWKT